MAVDAGSVDDCKLGRGLIGTQPMRIDASLMKARKLAASLSYRVATRRHCLILLKNRSIKLRARYRYALKRIGFLRLRFGGDIGPRALLAGKFLIQSSYPRSASNIVCGSKELAPCRA